MLTTRKSLSVHLNDICMLEVQPGRIAPEQARREYQPYKACHWNTTIIYHLL